MSKGAIFTVNSAYQIEKEQFEFVTLTDLVNQFFNGTFKRDTTRYPDKEDNRYVADFREHLQVSYDQKAHDWDLLDGGTFFPLHLGKITNVGRIDLKRWLEKEQNIVEMPQIAKMIRLSIGQVVPDSASVLNDEQVIDNLTDLGELAGWLSDYLVEARETLINIEDRTEKQDVALHQVNSDLDYLNDNSERRSYDE